MSVKVVNSGSGVIKITASTLPAVKVEEPEVNVIKVNPIVTGNITAPAGPTGPAGATGANGQGVPTGGSADQVLIKSSGDDYDTEWGSVDYSDVTNTPTLSDVATSGDYDDLSNAPSLSTVATSGSYNDLSDQPTITNNVDTDLSFTRDATSVTVISSDGDDAVLPESSLTQAGVMSAASHTKLANLSAAADATTETTVSAAGAVMDSDFTANGLMERTGDGAYTTVAKSTTSIPEGTNLYYTDDRVDDRIAAASVADLSDGGDVILTTTSDVSSASFVDTDDTFASATNNLVPSQLAVKNYVNNQLKPAIYSDTSDNPQLASGVTEDEIKALLNLEPLDLQGDVIANALSFNYGSITWTPNSGGGTLTYTGPTNSDIRGAVSVTQNAASGDGALSYTQGTGVISYTPPDLDSYLTSVSEADVTAHEAALEITVSQISDFGTYLTGSSSTSDLSDVSGAGTQNGGLLIYNSSSNSYVHNTLTAGTGISVTNGAGTVHIAATADDVTLASVTDNYLSLSGQEITAGTVPLSLGGTGATSAAGARTALSLEDSDIIGKFSGGTGITLAADGTISSDITQTSTTDDLDDVSVGGSADGQILIYHNANSQYEPSTITAGDNIAITNTGGRIEIDSTAQEGLTYTPFATLTGRFQFSSTDDNRTILCGNTSYGTNYYLWSTKIFNTVNNGTVDTTTQSISNSYGGVSFRMLERKKIRWDWQHRPINSSGYSKNYRAQIWSSSSLGSGIGGLNWTLRADEAFTSNSTTGGWLRASVTTDSEIQPGHYVMFVVGLDQTVTATTYLSFQSQTYLQD